MMDDGVLVPCVKMGVEALCAIIYLLYIYIEREILLHYIITLLCYFLYYNIIL